MRQGPHIEVRDPSWVWRIAWRGKTLFRWSWKRQLLQRVLPVPFPARHVEYSLLASTDDDVRPSERLIRLALQAIQRAAELRVAKLDRRLPADFPYPPSSWPGQHYRLLAALTELLQPRCVVEIGTGGGLSTLAFKHHLPPDGQVATFDLIPWQQHPDSVFIPEDFADHRLVQYTDNLCDPAALQRHQALLSRAELIFVDAAKDGVTEPKLLASLQQVPFLKPPLLVLDDIRVWTMLKVWREIPYPKLDLTSFGNWTGTGVVEFGVRDRGDAGLNS
jgi:predicted O-methyltransferase YrrM